MRAARGLSLVVCAASALWGCSLSNDFEYDFAERDGGDADIRRPDGASPDGSGDGGSKCTLSTECGPRMRCIQGVCVTHPPPPTRKYQTQGGGVTKTSRYRMRISIGFPNPPNAMTTRSDNFEVRLGPLGPQP